MPGSSWDWYPLFGLQLVRFFEPLPKIGAGRVMWCFLQEAER